MGTISSIESSYVHGRQHPSAARPKHGFNSKLAVDPASDMCFDVAVAVAHRRSGGGGVGMIKTKGILHITIPVSDPARSRAFYTDILGLDYVGQAPKGDNPHFVFLKSGSDYVVLGRESHRERFSDIIHHAFMVDGDAFDATVAELKAKGVNVFREDERAEGVFTGRSAYFHDPDNNALEVIHLTNNAKG